MKFATKPPLKHTDIGRTKVVEKFLLFPRKFNNEVRWLEKVKLVLKVKLIYEANWGESVQWREVAFADQYIKDKLLDL